MNRKSIEKIITTKEKIIPTCTFCNLIDKPGYYRDYEQLTVKAVHQHLEKFLKGLYVGEEQLEPYWVSILPPDEESLFPMGNIICGIDIGSNEGVFLKVLVRDTDDKTHLLFSAKYFEGADMVGLIAAKTMEAFSEGAGLQDELIVKEIYSSEQTPNQIIRAA